LTTKVREKTLLFYVQQSKGKAKNAKTILLDRRPDAGRAALRAVLGFARRSLRFYSQTSFAAPSQIGLRLSIAFGLVSFLLGRF
jgi:hypothetical protein